LPGHAFYQDIMSMARRVLDLDPLAWMRAGVLVKITKGTRLKMGRKNGTYQGD
jgi:hypothetical protein